MCLGVRRSRIDGMFAERSSNEWSNVYFLILLFVKMRPSTLTALRLTDEFGLNCSRQTNGFNFTIIVRLCVAHHSSYLQRNRISIRSDICTLYIDKDSTTIFDAKQWYHFQCCFWVITRMRNRSKTTACVCVRTLFCETKKKNKKK